MAGLAVAAGLCKAAKPLNTPFLEAAGGAFGVDVRWSHLLVMGGWMVFDEAVDRFQS